MKKLYLMNNPEVFQGGKYLSTSKNNVYYFEGWYFKNTNGVENLSFIPGININETERKAFIQVITNNESWFIDYDIKDFEYNSDPFWFRIGNNYFSNNRIHIDIKDKEFNLNISGDLKYRKKINIKKRLFSPNIMGIFSYMSFMECNHAVLCMKNKVYGGIIINDKKIEFSEGYGYIEKDFGCSFPKNYIWGQGNNFKDSDASFMISIADIPFKLFSFRGLICSLIVNDKEYRFATYNGAKIKKYEVSEELVHIILKKRCYTLEIEMISNDGFMLKAPIKGNMDKEILESINSIMTVTLKKKNKVIFHDFSYNCGLEIVNE